MAQIDPASGTPQSSYQPMVSSNYGAGAGGWGLPVLPSGGYQLYPGQPMRPDYTPGYNPMTMSMTPGLMQQLSGINVDKTGINKFRQEATRNGPSQWATLANAQQDQMAQRDQDSAAARAGSQGADLQSSLAMSGGLSSGAKERAMRDTSRAGLSMSQDIARQTGLNKTQIGVNDEQNRIQQLSQLPGMENTAIQNDMDKVRLWGQGQQFDTSQYGNEADRRNQFNSGVYQDNMAAWGAGQQANATANSGKK